jgi:hypothetical protein
MAGLNPSVNLGFLFQLLPGGGPEANPASFPRVPGRFPGKKLLVRGVEHAPPSNVKVKKE